VLEPFQARFCTVFIISCKKSLHWTYISNTIQPPLGAAHQSVAALIRMCLAFVSFLAFSWAPWSLALVPRSCVGVVPRRCVGVAFLWVDLITLRLFQN
jgi:hypothetical protein